MPVCLLFALHDTLMRYYIARCVATQYTSSLSSFTFALLGNISSWWNKFDARGCCRFYPFAPTSIYPSSCPLAHDWYSKIYWELNFWFPFAFINNNHRGWLRCRLLRLNERWCLIYFVILIPSISHNMKLFIDWRLLLLLLLLINLGATGWVDLNFPINHKTNSYSPACFDFPF